MRVHPFLAIAVVVTAGPVFAQDFTIDQASPEVPAVMAASDGAFTPGIPPVPLTFTGAVTLGLPAGVEVDAISYGVDQAQLLGSNNFMILYTSVTRGSVGAAGSAVAAQLNGVAGDRYRSTANAVGGFTAQTLSTDAPLLGLTIPPGVESNIDGLAHPPGASQSSGVYFSIDAGSAPLFGADEGSVLYKGPAIPPGAPPIVYATSAALGLMPGADEVDALIIDDVTTRAVLDAFDIVYVSLAPGSPTLAALGASPADLIQVFPGPPAVVISAAQLGLLAADDLDAATIFDPGLWEPVGGGKVGSGGVQPGLYGMGPLSGLSINTLTMAGAAPFSPVLLVVGLNLLNAPFKGGTFVPSPDLILPMPAPSATGELTFQFVWPTLIPPGVPLYFQFWVVDPGASAGYAASNGEQGTTQ